jgi:pimeloyl-ACP methyl ester carboxylesterase
MVLVDASHEDQADHVPWRTVRSRLIEELNWQIYRLNPLLARLGVLRLRGKPSGAPEALPAALQPMGRAVGLRSHAYDWIVHEGPAIEASQEEVRAAGGLGHIPLVVLSAHYHHCPPGVPRHQQESYRHRSDRAWMQLQRELTALSTRSTHIVVEGSGHDIHLDRPEAVVDGIRRVVDAVRVERRAVQPVTAPSSPRQSEGRRR